MARWASLIRQRRSEKPILMVDAGDFCPHQRTIHQDIKDRYFFDGMKRLPYAAVGVGENEIKFGRKHLLEAVKRADLPLVSSNVIDKRGQGYLAEPYVITSVGGRRLLLWRRGGIKIGILSVVLPAYIHTIDDDVHKYYDVRDTRMATLETVSTLRERGCDLIVALSHLGWENSLDLAQQVPGIDIVVNGHRTHNGMHYEYAGETIVIDTGVNRSSFTEIDVTIENGKPRFKAKDMGKVLLSFEGDPAFVELEKAYERELEASKESAAREKR